MKQVGFYHLSKSSASGALPQLLKKTLDADKRALVCCSAKDFKVLSAAIWSEIVDSWLPHGVVGSDEDDAKICPIWLTDDASSNPNEASYFFFLHQFESVADSPAERAFILFDGSNEEAVNESRSAWKALKDAEYDLEYWQQNVKGKWEKQGVSQ